MKYIKTNTLLLRVIHPLIFLVGALLFCLQPQLIIHSCYIFWISIPLIAIFIFSRLGNERFTCATQLPFLSWYTRIFLLEITLFGAYFGICLICGDSFAINTPPHPHLFSNTLRMMLTDFGLFPWSIYAVIAVAMGRLAFNQKTDAYFSNLLFPITRQSVHGQLSSSINLAARRCTISALSVTVLFLTLLIIQFFLPLQHYVASGFTAPTLITTVLLILGVTTKIIKKQIRKIFSNHLSTAFSFPVFCIVFGFALVLISTISHNAVRASTPTAIPEMHFIKVWIDYHWHTAWILFSIFYWLSFAPLFCSLITKISAGYRIRDTLLAILILPILVALFLHYPSHWFALSPLTYALLALISFLILLPALVNQHTLPQAIHAYFPKEGIFKTRDPEPFFEKLGALSVSFIYFYLVIGINGLSILFVALNYLIIPIFLLSFLTTLKPLQL